MARYAYRCPDHGEFDVDLPMGTAPQAVDCSQCSRRARRVYGPVPVHYLAPGFTRAGTHDRPDERLKKEIKHSMDFDVTTGLSWEETERQEEKRKADGTVRKKTIRLPEQGASDSVRVA